MLFMFWSVLLILQKKEAKWVIQIISILVWFTDKVYYVDPNWHIFELGLHNNGGEMILW